METEEIMEAIKESLVLTEPFLTAHEVGELYNITPQKASGILRKMENSGEIQSKRIKAGRNEVKCYFLDRRLI